MFMVDKNTRGGDETDEIKEVNNNVGNAVDFLHSSSDVNHPSLEKLAELTAVMSRFELDIVTASTPQRARSKSEPTPMGRFPKTIVVKSFENVNENIPDGYSTSDSAAVSEISSPPTATSERKETTATVTDSCYNGYMWSGELPPRNYSNPTFSSKIFVGGVPWDISETALIDAFSPYGACRVEWPSKEGRSHSNQRSRTKVTGYVYIVFETERSVKSLLQDCSQEFGSAGEWYFKLKARRNQSSEIRQVQVIPWVVSDSSYVDDPSCPLDLKKTVFVGALHGMITAHVLFSIMNELYGNVVFVGIDTDKYRYPIDDNGSRGEVAKSSPRCYLQSPGNVAVAPLGGVAAVSAVARGTVPRQQHHAYQYMQLAPAYPSTVYSPAVMQQRCRIGSNVATAPVVTGQPVTTSPSFIHQRLY
ncbi:hypothetical protein TELCIR_13150 [Teladorsagia circumcincta]|uniref:RRM domain-containing protein n=1 Tax=Teladorsagia circumcincta TaxID=45464 RepID=A0A2G9U4U2_TELCI|nr:hypothetical protein TELCIR_13150 [Teladorsagia circumcincta]